MRRTIPLLPILCSATLALCLGWSAPVSWAQEEEPEFSELRALIEINTTDGDAGFQMLIDGDGWKEVRVDDPNGQKIYTVKGDKSVQEQGLTENFFESAEPECSEEGFSLTDTLDRFPAGEYTVHGKSTDNEHFEGETPLTHAFRPGPANLLPSGGGVNAGGPITITWDIGDSLGNCPPDDPNDIPAFNTVPLFGYQVVVEREFPEPLLVFFAEVRGGQSVTLSPQFVQDDAIYKVEVVAIEERMNEDGDPVKGNQSISETVFCTGNVINPCESPE